MPRRKYSIENDEAVMVLLHSRRSRMTCRCTENAIRDYRLAARIATGGTFADRCGLADDLPAGAGRQHTRIAAAVAPLIVERGTPFHVDRERRLVLCCTLTLSTTGYFAAF